MDQKKRYRIIGRSHTEPCGTKAPDSSFNRHEINCCLVVERRNSVSSLMPRCS